MGMMAAKNNPIAEAVSETRLKQMGKICDRFKALNEMGKASVTVTELSDAIARRDWGLKPGALDDEFISYVDDYCKRTGGARKHYGVQPNVPKEILIEAIRNRVMPMIRYACGLDNNAPVDKVAVALKNAGLNISG